jgi:uncharacterized Zn finger protein (UPF0148 family)
MTAIKCPHCGKCFIEYGVAECPFCGKDFRVAEKDFDLPEGFDELFGGFKRGEQ